MLLASVNKAFKNSAILGVGVGWCREDKTACLLLLFFGWMVILGPHLPPNIRNQADRPA